MDFFEAVSKRYSHKQGFLPVPVPLNALEQIAEAGLKAPSGQNRQCVSLVILKDREAVQTLSDISPTIGLETAPAAIALFTDGKGQPGKFNFEVEDYAAAAAQILLAATAMGYCSLWLDSPFFSDENQQRAREALNAPEGYILRVVLPIGLPHEEGIKREKKPFSERVFYGKF